MKLVINLVLLGLLFSCSKSKFMEDKIFAGGVYASAETLNKGHEIYQLHCMACHGRDGDGMGVAAPGSKVPPRNFQQGLYKFTQVEAGELPHDEHFYRILEDGLKGTAMLPWDLSEDQMFAVVQYIKTFAPDVWEGKDKELGEEIVASRDPYGKAHRASAIKRGREVYHTEANCQACHMGYVTFSEFNELNENAFGFTVDELDPDFYEVKPQFSDYDYMNIPPDFTWHEVRLIDSIEDIYVRLAAGISGTAMPPWADVISDDDLWALAYYVDSLIQLKDAPEREVLMEKLRNQ